MPPQERQLLRSPAIILRRTNYGDADVVVTLFTLALGRVSALAKGARKSTRRFAGGLGVSLLGEGCLRSRGGEDGLYLLESFEVTRGRVDLAGDLAKTTHAAYVLELCDRLCPPGHPESSVYKWLESFLDVLEAKEASATRLRIFELGLLDKLGLAPSFSACSRCGKSDFGGDHVRFIPREGAVLCRACASGGDLISTSTRTALMALQVASIHSEIELEREVNVACRGVTLAILEGHLHGPLRSLEFMEKMSGPGSGSR